MHAIADLTSTGDLVPHSLDKKLNLAVSAVAEAAIRQGIARAEYVPCVEK